MNIEEGISSQHISKDISKDTTDKERKLVKQDISTELFPIVDEGGEVMGSMTRKEAHDGTMKLHPVVHLHVFNSKGELYLQHRSKWKKIQPDKWDTATGGHIDYGENVMEALMREVNEEIGLTPGSYEPVFIRKYIYDSPVEKELVYVFTTIYDGELSPSETETQGGRFWSIEEIKQNIGANVFTPMFETETSLLFE